MSIKSYLKGHSGVSLILVILVVIIAVVGGRLATRKTAESTGLNNPGVSLVDVHTFRDDLSTISVDGIVESSSQADIKSQVSAPVAQVYASVGDNVAQGQTIMEFQNADIRAQLEQARANLKLAQGQYTSESVADKIRDYYAKVDDALTLQIGQFLYTSNPNSKQFQTMIPDSSVADKLLIEHDAAVAALASWKKSVSLLTDNSTQEQINAVINESQKDLTIINKFLDTLSGALASATQWAGSSDLTYISAWKTITTTAKATVNAALSGVTSNNSSIATNQAQITAAEAGIKNLEAQLAKTVITAPISGTIAALPLRKGEFAGAGQLIATIVSPSGNLQIRAYAASEDLSRIEKGALVTVQGNIPGTVISVAPSVNQTNKKVEVKITVPGAERTNLVVGQSVQAKIEAKTVAATNKTASYILPIQNIKIVPGAAYVYTVDGDSKIVKHEVTLGEVKGDFVEVKSGIEDDMKIVSPVYELEEGQIVQIR